MSEPTEPNEPNEPNESEASERDRRDAQRVPIALRVEYKRVNSFFADYTRNISKGGTFIGTPKPLPLGTEFMFELCVPFLAEPLRLLGVVSWRILADEATEDQPAGMGIRFRYRDDDEQKAIHQVIETLLIERLGPVVARRLLDGKPNPP
ncbi:MAG: TIGR02266 family protein [Deltaproteobacteria bacterium]|nr:TIGR02266 family protein [Deltaproteobacteria bacterium]